MQVPRLDYAGARHHLTNRGARKSNVFVDDDDRAAFLDRLSKLPDRFGVEVHGWCLNPNHYHLLVRSMQGRLSQAMRFLGREYTLAFNRRHGRDGALFKGRFHNRIVSNPGYWQHLAAYVHGNPVKDRLFDDPDACPWTSHRYYVGLDEPPAWLTTDDLLSAFDDVAAYRDYLSGWLAGDIADPDQFDPDQLWAPHTSWGSPPEPPPEPGTEIAKGLKELEQVTGFSPDDIRFAARGRVGNPVTWVGAWWLCRRRGVAQRYWATVCGVSAMTISKRVAMAEERRESDPKVAAWMDALEKLLPRPTSA